MTAESGRGWAEALKGWPLLSGDRGNTSFCFVRSFVYKIFDFHDWNLRTTLRSVPYSHEQVAELRFTVALEHTHGRGLRGKNQHHSPVCLAICQGMATHLTGGQAARKRHCRLARVITVTWQSQYVNTGHTWSPLLPCLTAPLFFLIKAIV